MNERALPERLRMKASISPGGEHAWANVEAGIAQSMKTKMQTCVHILSLGPYGIVKGCCDLQKMTQIVTSFTYRSVLVQCSLHRRWKYACIAPHEKAHMPKKTNKAPKNPNIERDDLDNAAEDQDRNRKPSDVEERPNDRVRGREEGNKEGPSTPMPDPAGGNL